MPETSLPVEIPATIPPDAERRLGEGHVSVIGRMPNASNATFLVRLDEHADAVEPAANDDSDRAPWGLAIYKPRQGERPLWDFPPGLHRREAAAFRLSATSGLGIIPPTVLRDDAPFGEGSLQWFVNADFSEHYFSLVEQRPQLNDQMQALAVFDVIANNTDRKSGHCLFEPSADRVWGIDNGLCFSLDARLRTVIWEFGGTPIPDELRRIAELLGDEIPDSVSELLDGDEVDAMCRRAARLADRGRSLSIDRAAGTRGR